jgi:hypothetical protein
MTPGTELIVASTRRSLAALARRASAPRPAVDAAAVARKGGTIRVPLLGELDLDGLRRSVRQLVGRLPPR